MVLSGIDAPSRLTLLTVNLRLLGLQACAIFLCIFTRNDDVATCYRCPTSSTFMSSVLSNFLSSLVSYNFHKHRHTVLEQRRVV